jgi:hypothetical protein
MHFCTYCGGAIYPDDVAPVKLEAKAQLHLFFFQDSIERPCLKGKIEQLRQHFASQN